MCDVGLSEFFAQVLKAVRRKPLFIYQRFEVDDFVAVLDPCNTEFLRGLPDENVNRILLILVVIYLGPNTKQLSVLKLEHT